MGKKGKKKKGDVVQKNFNFSSEFDGLVSFEEIPSYKVFKTSYSGKRKKVKCVQVKSNQQAEEAIETEDDFMDKKGKKGKKEKRKKMDKKKNKEKVTDLLGKDLQPLEEESNISNLKRKAEDLPIENSTEKKKKLNAILGNAAEWQSLCTPEPVIEALMKLGFTTPTEIQKLTIPSAIKDRKDIVGAAETGSGKTLAFGIPIISGILFDREKQEEVDEEMDIDNTEEFNDVEDLSVDDDQGLGSEEIDPDFGSDFSETEEQSQITDSEEEAEIIDSEEEEKINEFEEDDISDLEGEDDVPLSEDEDDEEAGDKDGFENMTTEDAFEMEEGDDPFDLGDGGDDDENETKPFNQKRGCVKVIANANFDFLKNKAPLRQISPTNKLRALVVTPTRELAVQIKKHLDDILTSTTIKTAIVIGGLSQAKQERVLRKSPEIVIGTPGRLWEMVQAGNPHLCQISDIDYLAIDETDRMLEAGHFEELRHLLQLLTASKKRQTFIFSATLTMVHSAPKRLHFKGKPKEQNKETKLDNLLKLVGVRKKPKVVDVTRKLGTAETLSEARIYCEKDERDFYLYYFISTYPGRTLVFCNSIDCVRRLGNLLYLLNLKVQSLHAMKHQKERLKSLEKFTSSPESVLLATDVAARGLDIRGVDHILHYEVPKTAETYVHRSGRTARANQEGLSVILIEPGDMGKFRQLCSTLNRDQDLPPFPVSLEMMSQIKARVNLARKIETAEYRIRKKSTDDNWLKKMSEEAGLDYDDALSDDEAGEIMHRKKKMSSEINAYRKQLNILLSKQFVSKGLSLRYPTCTGKLINLNSTESDKPKTALSAAKLENVEHVNRLKNFKPTMKVKKVNTKKTKGFDKRKKKREEFKKMVEKANKNSS